MDKKYLAQIIATDNEGLQMISACTAGAKVKVSDIKGIDFNYSINALIKKDVVKNDLIKFFDYLSKLN